MLKHRIHRIKYQQLVREMLRVRFRGWIKTLKTQNEMLSKTNAKASVKARVKDRVRVKTFI